MMKNILTIDVEELFHAEYANGVEANRSCFRTPDNLPHILKLLDEYGCKATFFVVGQVAEKFPDFMKEISGGGHEVAFHSHAHCPLWRMNNSQLEKEIADFNILLTSVTGEKCKGFRAPSFSLDNNTKWAVEVLESSGMLYDSSIFPVWTPLYGLRRAPRYPYKPSKDDLTKVDSEGSLWEFPVATYQVLKLRLPAAGGFYLRLFPCVVNEAVNALNLQGMPAVLFFHNWELDPKTPRPKLGLYKSFVTYHNLDKTEAFLRDLLNDFEFTSFSDYLETTRMV